MTTEATTETNTLLSSELNTNENAGVTEATTEATNDAPNETTTDAPATDATAAEPTTEIKIDERTSNVEAKVEVKADEPVGPKIEPTPKKEKKEYKYDREFVMGVCTDLKGKLKDLNLNLSLNCQICQNFKTDKPCTRLEIILDKIRYQEMGIVGIKYDNIVMSTDFDKENTQNIVIESDAFLYFKEIELQHLYFHAIGTDPEQYWQCLNYIRLIDMDDKEYKIGEQKTEGTIETHIYDDKGQEVISDEFKQKFGDKYTHYRVIYSQSQIEYGQLSITGFSFSRGGLLGIQVADIVGPINTKNWLNIYRLSATQGIYEVENDYHVWKHELKKSLSKKILYGGLVGLENESIFNIFVNLYEDTFWYKDIRYSILPKFFNIIKESIDDNFAILHSVTALQRFMDFAIQDDYISNGICPEDKKSLEFKKTKRIGRAFGQFGNKKRKMYLPHLVKARYIFSHLSDVVKEISVLQHFGPSPDIFTVTYLDPGIVNYLTLAAVFVSQLLLFGLVVSQLSLDFAKNAVSIPTAIILATLTFAIVVKQMQNIFAFFQVYPYSIKHPVIWLSCIVNIGLAVALIPVNVLILATTEDQLELVLNALAILFILEVDDQVVDSYDMSSVYLSYYQARIISKLENCDLNYIEKFKNSQGSKKQHDVDYPNCAIIFDDNNKNDN